MGPLFKLYYRPKIINKNVIPTACPVLYCGNHSNKLDVLLASIAIRRTTHWMVKKECFEGKIGLFFKWTGHIAVDRKGDTSKAKKEALDCLQMRRVVGIFPEGTLNRTRELELLPFKLGAVSLAKKSNAFIVPFGISGGRKLGGQLTIRIGTPFKVGDMTLEEANEELTAQVLQLIRSDKEVNGA